MALPQIAEWMSEIVLWHNDSLQAFVFHMLIPFRLLSALKCAHFPVKEGLRGFTEACYSEAIIPWRCNDF